MQTYQHRTQCKRPAIFGSLAVFAATLVMYSNAADAADCQIPDYSSRCGLYADVSGSAGASIVGNNQSYGPKTMPGDRLDVSLGGSDGDAVSSASFGAGGYATYGALGSTSAANALTHGIPNASHAGASANANFYFSDALTFIDATMPAGTLGVMTGRLSVTGSLFASTTDPWTSSRASVQVVAGGISTTKTEYGDRPPVGSMPSFITFTLPVNFNVVDYTKLNVQLQTSAYSLAYNRINWVYGVDASAVYGSTVEWVGIDQVVDASGNVVTGWTVNSASGFDYSRSFASQVPEPTSFAMMLAGALLIGAFRFRNRPTQEARTPIAA